jgi:5-methylcytosine-specific restriction endonuclease McrBC GTP-binding regulatory subunit McrB
MNLAPVEQYFAEFLSVLETRSRDKEDNVVTGALVDKQYFKDDTKMKEDLGLDGGDDWTIEVRSDLVNKGLTLPPNLIVIGTVNMDDTTYQFSRKVIDRAMTIEMNGGELSQMFDRTGDRFAVPDEEKK